MLETGSMLYGFGAFLVIYLAGVLIYQVVLWIQKWKRKKKKRRRTGKWLM